MKEGSTDQSIHKSIMAKTYDKYYSTGFYNQRYPVPNKLTYNCVLNELQKIDSEPKHILDFGCGSGRYLFPILKSTQDNFTAYDISETTQRLLTDRLVVEGGHERVSIIQGDLDKLTKHIEKNGKVDLIMMLFGVLSHVGNRLERLKLLRRLATFLANDSSHIIISVPNRLRRFKRNNGNLLKSDQEPGDIIYSREHKGTKLTFFYHLYTSETLVAELKEAGLMVYKICAESYFPESWVTKSTILGIVDRAICKILPARQGYGILAVIGLDKTSRD